MINRKFILFVFVAILAICPFFWFKPGEVNLGGDSTRLYFYNPLLFITGYSLYGVNPWNIGNEMISYFFIPFSLFLEFIKIFVKSLHNLINVFDSFSLVAAFLGTYLSVSSIILDIGHFKEKNKHLTTVVGIISGLFYVFAPMMTNWDKSLITFNNLFLNPIIFFLLYKLVNTKKYIYIFVIIFITFIFSPNFSFIGAPTFFSFFPFVFLYFILFNLFVKKDNFNFKQITIMLLLFLGVQAFHLIPQIAAIADPTTNAAQRVFGTGGSNAGNTYVEYFTSVANSIYMSHNLIGVPQNDSLLNIFYFVFPFVIILSLLQYPRNDEEKIIKKQLIILLFIFLISLFFTSGHLTVFGFLLYKSLFYLPGFGMFRNFYGQFISTFFFFYALCIGLCLYILLNNSLLKIRRYLLVFGILVLLLIRGLPLLDGDMVHLTVLQAKNHVSVPFIVPQSFEKLMVYISSEKIDAKIITFPFTDFGYQMLGGEKGGLYIGSSFIGALTLHKDYTGYEIMGPMGSAFINAAKNGETTTMQNVLSMLNVHDVVWNKDPFVYGSNFPSFPYLTTKVYIPTAINAYEKLINALQIKNVNTFGQYYKVINLDPSLILPKIFSSKSIVYMTSPEDSPYLFNEDSKGANAILPNSNYSSFIPDASFQANRIDVFSQLNNNEQFHKAMPDSVWEPGNIFYPLIVWRENRTISKTPFPYKFDAIFLSLAKRIAEIKKWGNQLPLLQKQIVLKGGFNGLFNWGQYESLDAILVHYDDAATNLIAEMNKYSGQISVSQKILIQEQFEQHRMRMYEAIETLDIDIASKKYLEKMSNEMFDKYANRLALPFLNTQERQYSLTIPHGAGGLYSISLTHISQGTDYPRINIQGSEYMQTPQQDNLISFGQVVLPEATEIPITLTANEKNLAEITNWEGMGTVISENGIDVINFNNPKETLINEMVREIPLVPSSRKYVVSFYYKTGNVPFAVKLLDKRKKENNDFETYEYSTRLLTSSDWRLYQTVFTTDPKTISAFLNVQNTSNSEVANIFIKNMTITAVENPVLTLRRITSGTTPLPEIIFQRINPTKYKIFVKNASGPYVLNFLEGFSNNWKLYMMPSEESKFAIAATYFNGLVKEGGHENVYFDKTMLEAWSKKSIADKSHAMLYGYANSWIISPSDTQGKSSYTLILELQSQRIFFIGLIVSAMTILAMCLVALTFFLMRIKRKLLH